MMKYTQSHSIFLLLLLGVLVSEGSFASIPSKVPLPIDTDAVVVDLSTYAKSSVLYFATSNNRVLAFEYVEGDISKLNANIKIRDGFNPQSASITLEQKLVSNGDRFNIGSQRTAYTKGNLAAVEILNALPSGTHLKIQKAIDCPFNLGPSSQCGRVVDDVSCYCATYTPRSWEDQKAFCQDKGFQLISIETQEEENAIYAAWGKETYYWTSLTDIRRENVYVWNTTDVPLNPGYANWDFAQPDGPRDCSTDDHDCVHLNWLGGGWNDDACSSTYQAICENHP